MALPIIPIVWTAIAAATAAAGAYGAIKVLGNKSEENNHKTSGQKSNNTPKIQKTSAKNDIKHPKSEIDAAYDDFLSPKNKSETSSKVFDHTTYNKAQYDKLQKEKIKPSSSKKTNVATSAPSKNKTVPIVSEPSAKNDIKHPKSEIDAAYDVFLSPKNKSETSSKAFDHTTYNKTQYDKLQKEMLKKTNTAVSKEVYENACTADKSIQNPKEQRRAKRLKTYLSDFVQASGYTLKQFEAFHKLPRGFIMYLQNEADNISVSDYDKFGYILINQKGPKYISTYNNNILILLMYYLVEEPTKTTPQQRELMEKLLKKLAEITISNDSKRNSYAEEIDILLNRLVNLYILS